MHVLIATEANEGLGHIFPWKVLIEQLIHQGHQVTFACPQPHLAQSVLRIKRLNYPSILWPSMHAGVTPAHTDNWGELLASLGYASRKAVGACFNHWVEFLRHAQPDWVIADYAPLAMLAAKALKLSLIEAGGGFCLPPDDPKFALALPTTSPPSRVQPAQLDNANRAGQQVVQAFNAALQSATQMLRLQTLSDIYALADHRCVTSTAALDPYHTATAPRSNVQHIGPLAQASTGPSITEAFHGWALAPSPQTRILCYLKPNTPGLHQVEQTLEQLPACQVLATGWERLGPKLLPEPTQATLSFAHGTIDFLSAMPLAKIFITNGGLHSLSWALQNHCHCILLPSQAEQAATALHLAQHPQLTVCTDAHSLAPAIAQARTSASAIAPHTTATLHSAEQQLRKLMQSPSTANHARQLLCSQQL